MGTRLVNISEVTILSVDKSADSWAIEGEILFEPDVSAPFSAVYYEEDDELDELELETEIMPGAYDKKQLKEMIIAAAEEFDGN